jgi:3-deoxy-D-manno-octulosonic-acid transferase
LLRRLKSAYPGNAIVCSTGTTEAHRLAAGCADIDLPVALPLDAAVICRHALSVINPSVVIMLETEIWPNFILALSTRSIPLYLVNARLDDRAYRHYRLLKPLFAPLLQRYRTIAVQTENDLQRFSRLGVPHQRLQLAGNLKFDAARLQLNESAGCDWRQRLQLQTHQIVLLGGCTTAGEESLLTDIYQDLLQQGIPLRLILAPRQINRAAAICRQLAGKNIAVIRRSRLVEHNLPQQAVIVIDSIGELAQIYAAADIVFIGKSLCGRGGHNPLEAAARGKAIVFGPQMQNFRAVVSQLLEHDAAVRVNSAAELAAALAQLVRHSKTRERLGANAKQVVQNHQGALAKTLQILTQSSRMPAQSS